MNINLCTNINLCENINLYIIILLYIFLIYSLFSKDPFIVRASIYLSFFLLIKWIFNHRNCSFGFFECKIRKVERKKGYINNLCNFYGDLIYNEYNDILYITMVLIYFVNIIKLYIILI